MMTKTAVYYGVQVVVPGTCCCPLADLDRWTFSTNPELLVACSQNAVVLVSRPAKSLSKLATNAKSLPLPSKPPDCFELTLPSSSLNLACTPYCSFNQRGGSSESNARQWSWITPYRRVPAATCQGENLPNLLHDQYSGSFLTGIGNQHSIFPISFIRPQ